jgi:hypothetical protein
MLYVNILLKHSRKTDVPEHWDELDSNFGLHDYRIFVSFRNQTKTTFLSFSKHIYTASTVKHEKYSFGEQNEFVILSACEDVDRNNSLGQDLTHLPRLTWHTEIMKKNDIDGICLVDLIVFDANDKQLIASSFPVNLSKEKAGERFLAEQTYHSDHVGKDFIFRSVITCYKVKYFLKDKIYL